MHARGLLGDWLALLNRATGKVRPGTEVEILRGDNGIVPGTDGPHHNVIALRAPLIFSQADADLFSATLGSVLGEDPAESAR